ncbi:hypothetical protein C8Q76DRAFT_71279 [Earliella scabrosa]|nr:hypothetical protein C8Q76DRAFT_71279 [Earliella scabrosa]
MYALSLVFVAFIAGHATAMLTGELLPRQDGAIGNTVPESCVTSCGVIETYNKCGKDTGCACTAAIHTDLGGCLQCAINSTDDTNRAAERSKQQETMDAYERACRAAGTDFTAIELQPVPQPDGAATVARSSGAVAGVVGAVVAALAL